MFHHMHRTYRLCVSTPRSKIIWPQWAPSSRFYLGPLCAYGPRPYSTDSKVSPSSAALGARAWTQEEVDKMLQLHKEGVKGRIIAKVLNRSFRSVRARYDRAVRYGTINASSLSRTSYASRMWSKDELNTLKKLLAAGNTYMAIAAVLNRTPNSVRAAERRHLLVPDESTQKYRPWSEAELATFRQMREEGRTSTEIALAIGRSHKSVESMVELQRKTPLRHAIHREPWSETESDRLLKLRGQGLTWKQISSHLPGRSAQAAAIHWERHLRDANGYKYYRDRRNWTTEEVEVLERLRAEGVSRRQIAKRIGRSYSTVLSKLGKSLTSPPNKVADPWTPDDIARLIALKSESRKWNEIGRLLGRTPGACSIKHHKMQRDKHSSA